MVMSPLTDDASVGSTDDSFIWPLIDDVSLWLPTDDVWLLINGALD